VVAAARPTTLLRLEGGDLLVEKAAGAGRASSGHRFRRAAAACR
jgi:hypothetical protein